MDVRWYAAALLLAGANSAAQAETFRCPLADRVVSYQQTPCAVPELPGHRPESPPPRVIAPQPHAADAPFSSLTPGKKEVLDLTARFERCRAEPGFAARTEDLYQAWKRRHAATLSEYSHLLAVKLRVASRSEPMACNDDWLREVQALARAPDARFSSVEKTWELFVAGLRAADRPAVLACVSGPIARVMSERLEKLPDAALRRMAANVRELKVLWGDDYDREALIVHGDSVDGVVFRKNVNEEWKIREMKPAALRPATPRRSSPDS